MNRKQSLIFNCIDLTCAILFVLGVILFSQVGEPYKRGFFCNDESIQKPYKDSTISTPMAAAVGFALVLVVVVITEIYANHQKKLSRSSNQSESRSVWFCSSKILPVIITIAWVICANLYGAAMNQFITDVGKYSIGRLRPHFLDVCKPDWSRFNCTDERGNYVFIVEDVCTVAKGTKKARDLRLSFPSGQSSFAAYLMVFLALYIEAKLHLPKESKFLKPTIQAALIMIALYTGFSRVSDYKHHWSDVLAGFFLGTVIAFVAIFRVLKLPFGKEYSGDDTEALKRPETEHMMAFKPQHTDDGT